MWVNVIELFPHTQTAYENTLTMMAQTGKMDITHPTGMGKSFVGFQLVLDNPDKQIYWMSPSEYIFKPNWKIWQMPMTVMCLCWACLLPISGIWTNNGI